MKHLINKQFIAIIAIAMSMAFFSCKKETTEEPEPIPTPAEIPKGEFLLHLHTYIDQEEVDLYNIPYATSQGHEITLTMAQLYISSIQLEKLDGSFVDVAGKILLKTLQAQTYLVGDVPVGNYKGLRFKVGLDATTNAANPNTVADSVALNKPAMWFGSTPQPDGYIFMNVTGIYEISSGGTSVTSVFNYKIGTAANYKQVIMPAHNFSIVEGQVAFGHIIIDYSKLFTGIQLNDPNNLSVITPADNSSAVAATIVNNIPSMFIYEP